MITTFTDLDVWKKARLLRNNISSLTKNFPPAEKYRLTDQIIRSSRSIGNNIAEGYGRYHYTDSKKFFVNARGSATETIDHLFVAFDEGYIPEKAFQEFESACQECLRLLNGYINYLKKQADSP